MRTQLNFFINQGYGGATGQRTHTVFFINVRLSSSFSIVLLNTYIFYIFMYLADFPAK